MGVVALSVSSDFGYVVLVCLLSFFFLQYLGFKVGKARKTYNVRYPTMYSDKEPMFNCFQRAHQNTLEVYTAFLMLLIFGGLQYPRVSAAAGVIWLVGRYFYAQGYYTGDPEKRLRGSFGYIGLFTLLGTTVAFALNLLGWI